MHARARLVPRPAPRQQQQRQRRRRRGPARVPACAAGAGSDAAAAGDVAQAEAEAEADAEFLEGLLRSASERRERDGLLARMAAEKTTAWRAFNGAGEGVGGMAVDLYGVADGDAGGERRALCQCWREPLTVADLAAVRRVFPGAAYRVRGAAARALRREGAGEGSVPLAEPTPFVERTDGEAYFTELGVTYLYTDPRPPGNDPPLFLDARPMRRRVRELCEEAAEAGAPLSVLNTFAYTGGMGVVAAQAGAQPVLNLDHSKSYLAAARANAERNGVRMGTICGDYFLGISQLAGKEWKVRGRSRGGGRGGGPKGGRGPKQYRFGNATRPPRVARAQTFDLVVLDPPTFTKSKYGVVDIERDYAAVFKPALLCLNPGGRVICTNHHGGIDEDAWHESLRRCAAKAGRPLASVEAVRPRGDDDVDFVPEADREPMLKVALVRLAQEGDGGGEEESSSAPADVTQ